MKVVVIYYSRTSNTKKMAEIIYNQIKSNGVDVDIFSVEDIKPQKLLDYDGIIIGSPTYYGAPAFQIKKFLDESVALHGRLDGKVGMAFTSSYNIGGGNETTILSVLQAMLIHGMIIQGDYEGDHYGAVSIGKVDSRCEKNCKRMADRFVDLLKKIKK